MESSFLCCLRETEQQSPMSLFPIFVILLSPSQKVNNGVLDAAPSVSTASALSLGTDEQCEPLIREPLTPEPHSQNEHSQNPTQ